MSLIPFNHPFFRGGDWWDREFPTPERLFDQHFGLAPYWLRSRAASVPTEVETGMSEVKNEKDKFTVNLDVSHFSPEEIHVKTKDNNLIITGGHEEKMDPHGFVSRTFTRRYVLPKEVDMEHIVSNLSHDGVLTVEAKKKMIEAPNERTIPIGTTNRPAIKQAGQQHK